MSGAPLFEFWIATAGWVAHHWYWPALLALILFAYGFYRNWEKERRRAKLTDSELAARLGDIPGSGGATESYADAELPDSRQKIRPSGRQ